MTHASKFSTLAQIVKEVTDLAELQALLQRQDWNPLRFFDELRQAAKNPTRQSTTCEGVEHKRKRLIRLAALSIVGIWILDLGGK